MASRIYYVYFIRMDTRLGPIRLCSAGQGVVKPSSKWGQYVPAGQFLRIEKPSDTSSPDGEYFNLTLSVSTPAIIKKMFDNSFADDPVYMYRANGIIDGHDVFIDNPKLIQRARVSHVSGNKGSITATCYTPALDLDSIIHGARNYSDRQQRTFVDKDDYMFRWADKPLGELGLVTHLRK